MKTILIIDDDIVFSKTLADSLKDTYKVVLAGDGESGLELAEKEKPNLIVLDILMPKLGGLEFLVKLRQKNEGVQPTPVLIVSNLSSLEAISQGVIYGVKGYIVKSQENLENLRKEIDTLFAVNK